MLGAKDWCLYVILPLLAVVILDQTTKYWAPALAGIGDLGPLQVVLQKNPGFMLGTFTGSSELYTIVLPATVGALLVFIYAAIQYFLPFRTLSLRTGLGIFLGGILGNLVDRTTYGFVRDVLVLDFGSVSTAVFNVADAMQWIGVVHFGIGYWRSGRLFYPPDERRGRKWIDPPFQMRYCLTLVGVGVGFSLVAGVLSYTYLSVSIARIAQLGVRETHLFISSFLTTYGVASVAFFVTLFALGVIMSHRIVGPLKGFENFLDDAIRGNARQFKLRHTDQLRQLEDLASRFLEHFGGELGVTPRPLAAGDHAPAFEAMTHDGLRLDLNQFLGHPVWIIFYRYASCPLCAAHLESARGTIARVKATGATVLLVYESRPESFIQPSCGATSDLLMSMGVPLIADPDRAIYRRYRTRTSLLPLFRLRTLSSLWSARRLGFRQGTIDGSLGQLPAHFVLDATGRIAMVHYGEDWTDHLAMTKVEGYMTEHA